MTISQFQKYLKKVNPKLQLRQRGYGDIVGLFAGKSGKGGYILRMTKGEVTLHGYREQLVNPENPTEMVNGIIKKRSRKTVVNLLRSWRWVKTHKERSMLLCGIKS